ncbi:MAG: GGDEF domain-containing protein [Rhizobiales bacterium]|nr:GGDEF domain-containing protein [Hyphomicrobiales bacterium]
MDRSDMTFSLPTWRITRWLVEPGPDVPENIRHALIASLFGTLPIFIGGAINTILVSAAVAIRQPKPLFIAWLCLEIILCVSRFIVLVTAQRAAAAGRRTPTDISILLAVCWGFSVGFGTFLGLTCGDWVIATLTCLSAAAMVGGICFRNFGAPRMAATMIVLSLGPLCLGTLFAGEPMLLVVFLQIPFYLYSMSAAAFRLNRMMVTTMKAEQENAHRARHDALTGLSNRTGLTTTMSERLKAGADAPARLALLYLDLDGFKAVNDTYGHAAGDRVLQMVADRLNGLVRAGDVTARLGGDEFVVLIEAIDPDAAMLFGERLIDRITGRYELGQGAEASIGVSIGIACAPDHGTDVATLLAAADAALYVAKSLGKSRCALASSVEATASPLWSALPPDHQALAGPASASRSAA